MTMVIIVNSAQSDRIKMMLTDDLRSNGINYIIQLQDFVNNLVEQEIDSLIKNKYMDEITFLSDVMLSELFIDFEPDNYGLIQILINYISTTFNKEKVTVGDLLLINYSELINNGVISLDTLRLLTSKLDEIKIQRLNVKQKTKSFKI